MDFIRSELEKRLKKKRAEISALEAEVERHEDGIEDCRNKISTLDATLQELQSLYNLIPSQADAAGPQPAFRQNSEGWLVHELLRVENRPMYIDEILEKLEREIDGDSRSSLAGQLGGYVRKGQVFTRPAPNTFGLREWEVNGRPLTREEEFRGPGPFTIRASIPDEDDAETDLLPALSLDDDEDGDEAH